MEVVVKSIINVFTVDNGNVKILLKNKDLVSITCNGEIDDIVSKYIKETLNLDVLTLKQCYTFSEIKDDKLIVSVLFMGIIELNKINLKDDFYLEYIYNLKDNVYVNKSLELFKKEIVSIKTMRALYPSEFSLPQIQKIFEGIFEKKYDRRNFRKKLIKLDAIELIDKKSLTVNGRPAKLYKFKNIDDNISLI